MERSLDPTEFDPIDDDEGYDPDEDPDLGGTEAGDDPEDPSERDPAEG